MDSKVVIIGAGASGIAAATKALEFGFSNIILLEAENRIGGRIYNIPFSKNKIDLGAHWWNSKCGHNEEISNLFQNTYPYKDLNCIRSNKDIVEQDICEKLQQIITELSKKGQCILKLSNSSLRTYILKNFNQWLQDPENNNISRSLAHEFFEFYLKFKNSIKCFDNFSEAPCAYLNSSEYDSDNHLRSNYSKYGILNYLMKSSNEKQFGVLDEKIFLNKKIKKIQWSVNTGTQTVLTCSDGSQIEADHVFCTLSLGVLKENYLSLFNPNLPCQKIKAIESLSFDTINKIFIEFSYSFWDSNWSGFNMLWDEKELHDIQKRSDNWIKDIFGFFPVDDLENTLCAWIVGESAKIMELASDDEVLNSCVFLLSKFLNWDIPIPVNIKRSKWNTNPNFRGSYSLQTEYLHTSPFYLAAPILDTDGIPIIQFCGDATHDQYYSTIHGAIESGWREAQRLADIYNINQNVDTNNYDVLILGAGLAGLGAAYALRNSDMKFKIVEAQDYIGGRALTVPLQLGEHHSIDSLNQNLTCVDTGPQWLHGEQNVLYQIAQKYNLISPDQSEEGLGSYIRDDGYIFDDLFRKKVDGFVQTSLDNCKLFINSEEFPISVGDYLDTKFQEFLKSLEGFDERKKALQLLDWHRRFQIIDNSCLTLEELSAKEWGKYAIDGESCQAHINLRYGFSSLIDAIIAEIGGTDNILLQQEINEINWNCSANSNKMIKVTTKNNKTFNAKHVIVTFSLGILKYTESNLFKPNLPQNYRTAIDSMGFETINKIFLQFDKQWWGNLNGIQLVYSDDAPMHKKWTRFISGFDILTPGPTNTLIGWVGSSGAIEMEKLSDKEIMEDCIELLRKFTNFVIPHPVKYYCTRWGSNKFVRGGYSYISVQCDKNNVDKKIFTEPISGKLLFIGNCVEKLYNNKDEFDPPKEFYAYPTLSFAGEAFHNNYFSTAHGAFLSGMEQINFLLNNKKI